MSIVKRYKNMDSSLTDIFEDVLTEIEKEKELKIINKLKGETKNGKPFLSVSATRVGVPTNIFGEVRELTITITGTSNDYVVETHVGCWKCGRTKVEGISSAEESLKKPQPVFGVPAFSYGNDLVKRIDELVRKNSKGDLGSENIEVIDG